VSGADPGRDPTAVDTAALFSPVAEIEKYLRTSLDELCAHDPPALKEAIEYAVMTGGKRLRPLLAWYWSEATGAPGKASLPAGAAVEFVHAFSLVHDDLPALDNDDLRRGKPTVHKQFGEAMAILVGDALLNLAQLVLARCGDGPQGLLSTSLSQGTQRMIAGQVYDTVGGFRKGESPEKQLATIHSLKTASLISTACVLGHFCGLNWREKNGKAGGFLKQEHGEYGEALGLMFQIVDDLIDVTESQDHVGKRTGKDAAAGKLTYPGVIGIQGSRQEVARLKTEALKAVAGLGPAAQPLRDLCEYLCVRTR
jgi:geranylgeranyl diphosphate synthase type II